MIDPSPAAQEGLRSALAADAGLQALMGAAPRVFDVVPPKGAKFPYLVLDGLHAIPDDAEGIDGTDLHPSVHVWSRPSTLTTLEAKQIAARVCRVVAPAETDLADPPALDGFVIQEAVVEGVDHLLDPDGITAHSVVRLRWTIEPQ